MNFKKRVATTLLRGEGRGGGDGGGTDVYLGVIFEDF